MGYRKVYYWSEDDAAYITEVPSLPECITDGKTIEESLKNADAIIGEWIGFAKELGRDIPPEDYVGNEEHATLIPVPSWIKS